MKYIALIPLILVSACVQNQDDMMVTYNNDEAFLYEDSVELLYEEDKAEEPLGRYAFEEIDPSQDTMLLAPSHSDETLMEVQPNAQTSDMQPVQQPVVVQPNMPTSYVQPVQQPIVVQPNMPTPYVQPVQQELVVQPNMPISYAQPVQSIVLQPVMPSSNMVQPEVQRQYAAKTMPDGSIVIEMPTQQLYFPDETFHQKYVVAPQNVNAPVSVSQPIENTEIQSQVVVPILLQHPERPDLQVQCQSNDASCITSFEQQGFIQVRYFPHSAAYRELPANSDYPAVGRWRHQNNIPRW